MSVPQVGDWGRAVSEPGEVTTIGDHNIYLRHADSHETRWIDTRCSWEPLERPLPSLPAEQDDDWMVRPRAALRWLDDAWVSHLDGWEISQSTAELLADGWTWLRANGERVLPAEAVPHE